MPAETRSSAQPVSTATFPRSEEHTSELQSHLNLVCRLLLEKKKNNADVQHELKRKRVIMRYSLQRRNENTLHCIVSHFNEVVEDSRATIENHRNAIVQLRA